MNNNIRTYVKIGIALSIEKDLDKLLEMIVDGARELSNADAGTLYMVDKDKKSLSFEILQNNSMKIKIGGIGQKKASFPNVPMYIEESPNYANVSSYVALTGKTVNIENVYNSETFDFTGPKKYDSSTGYLSKSMVAVPMKNHENQIIGVLQLLNAIDKTTGEITAFSDENVEFISSLASQAAVAMTNVQLVQDLKNLFYSFIESIATAIDEKSITTGGHIRRVADLTMDIAKELSKTKEGCFKDVHFNGDEMEELRLAAWMHDIGKITTPEHIINKSTKLETLYDRITLIDMRFQTIGKIFENKSLLEKIDLIESGNADAVKLQSITDACNDKLKELNDDFSFVKACNNTGDFMKEESVERIKKIASQTYYTNNTASSYLTDDEVKNLCIRKGTLLAEERIIIENHTKMTVKMLAHLPFPQKLSNVFKYAGSHHEKLDGTGYPNGLTLNELPIQSRILAIADVFEALTAPDRPYREPIKLSKAIQILGFMKKDGHIDPDIFDLFTKNQIYNDYIKRELNPSQIDL